LHLVTRLDGSAVVVVDLVQVGLDNLYVVTIQHLAPAMLKQIKDLEHYLVACFLTSRKLGAEGSCRHGVLRVCCANLSWWQWPSGGFDPPPHGWSDDHLDRRLHHLHEGEDVDLVVTLNSVVQLRRVDREVKLCSLELRIFLAEVCAVLLVVENNEEHVVSSECAVPISAGGNHWARVCT